MLYNELDRTTNRFHFVLILTSALNPTAALNHSAAAATATHSTAAAALIFDIPKPNLALHYFFSSFFFFFFFKNQALH